MIRYKVTNAPNPVAVECPIPGYPNPDADGGFQYNNTHFDSEEECWKRLMDERGAGLFLATNSVRGATDHLLSCKEHCVEAALAYEEAKRGHEKWLKDRGKS